MHIAFVLVDLDGIAKSPYVGIMPINTSRKVEESFVAEPGWKDLSGNDPTELHTFPRGCHRLVVQAFGQPGSCRETA